MRRPDLKVEADAVVLVLLTVSVECHWLCSFVVIRLPRVRGSRDPSYQQHHLLDVLGRVCYRNANIEGKSFSFWNTPEESCRLTNQGNRCCSADKCLCSVAELRILASIVLAPKPNVATVIIDSQGSASFARCLLLTSHFRRLKSAEVSISHSTAQSPS